MRAMRHAGAAATARASEFLRASNRDFIIRLIQGSFRSILRSTVF